MLNLLERALALDAAARRAEKNGRQVCQIARYAMMDCFEEQLNRAGGQVAEAAQRAGMPRQYFYEKMKRWGIPRS